MGLTHGTETGLFNDRERTVVDGEMSDVYPEEHEALQLGQVVVPQLQVKYDYRGLPLQHRHGLADVLQIGELAQDVQPVLLGRAHAGLQLGPGRAVLGGLGVRGGGEVDAQGDHRPRVAGHAAVTTLGGLHPAT